MEKIAIIVLAVLLAGVSAWDGTGHQYLASKVCRDFSCGCSTDEGSVAPDRVFRDTINHHCYNTSWRCRDGDWTCPAKDDCPALEKAGDWIGKAANQTKCERWYSVAVASHYFFDSKVFWHRVQGEDGRCHSGFESDAGKKFGKPGNWNVSRCGVSLDSSEVPQWVLEFENRLMAAGIEPEKRASNFAIWAVPAIFIIAAIAAVLAKIKTRPRRPSS